MTEPARLLYDALRARLGGGRRGDACAGLDLPGLRAVSLPLSGAGLELALAPGVDLVNAPASWRCAGVDVPLRVARGPRWRAQVATAERAADSNGHGTVGALVRDRLDPSRRFILTCGHVLAGTPRVKLFDQTTVKAGGVSGIARLLDWEPTLGREVVRTGLDAAIADVRDEALLQALLGEPLPSGTSGDVWFDQPVTVRADAPKAGLLKAWWSGYVDVPDTDLDADYFLENAVSYLATPGTIGGDSGAAVWDADSNALLGLHVAAPGDDEQFRANAVMSPIGPILDWFDIDPICATEDRSRLATTPPPRIVPTEGADARDRQRTIIAQTLWGEARGEPPEGMRAVASVIERRRQLHWRKATTAAEVCLTPLQFSCWNERDPNRARMIAVARQPDTAYERALALADDILDGTLDENAEGATHYYAMSLPTPPDWAKGRSPCCRIGNHLFFRDIR